jgi:hypothetical protein
MKLIPELQNPENVEGTLNTLLGIDKPWNLRFCI